MTSRILFLLFFSLSAAGLWAQSPIIRSLERNVPGQGTVTVEQDARLDEWLRLGKVPATQATSPQGDTGKEATGIPPSSTQVAAAGEKAQADTLSTEDSDRKELAGRPVKRSGFRIQIYSGPATRDSKNKATAAAAKVKEQFPHLSAYPIFVSPRWLCVVGDFLTHEEAEKAREELLATGEFTECSIVRSQVLVIL